ncbi:hypothetical protein T459_03209 [Capsicum annuum]|uniref:Bax inhibitor 1-like n=1 Tax=Capsicum annuum TaxID=4072 RepID=A0A2G3AM63_CAPAN|nr:hypothetical protein T459_03209 [Capsicum annuum]
MQKKKVLLAGFAFGASVGIFTKCFFQTDQNSVVSFLVGAAICFGAFWCGAKVSRLRLIIYASGLSVSYVFIYLWFVIASDMIFDGLTYSWTLTVFAVLALFMAYFVIYSQDIVYIALSDDVDFVKCTFTIFSNLSTLLFRVARLEVNAMMEHCRQS